jgi:ribonuclease HII
VDEVGRGPCAGPVVAAAVIIPKNLLSASWIAGIQDSKKIAAKKRDYLYGEIISHCPYAIAESSVVEIDDINILNAALLAMRRAVLALPVTPELVLVDGNKLPDLPMGGQTVIGGDGKILSIAAASIIAKVYRDRLMAQLAGDHPQYGWAQNAGYGTAMHLAALQQYGVSPHHRRSFAPVRQILENQNKSAA